MADQQISIGGPHQVTNRSILYATLAGLAIGGPLLGMMGFSLIASITILLISSPLLFLFSPILIPAALFLLAAMAGFAAAAAMALTGISAFVWILRGIRGTVGFDGGITEKLTVCGQRVREKGKEWAEYLQQTVQENRPDENKVNGG